MSLNDSTPTSHALPEQVHPPKLKHNLSSVRTFISILGLSFGGEEGSASHLQDSSLGGPVHGIPILLSTFLL